ncbi:penicillin-binding protein 1A [Arcticibacter tournemirensis]|uniref:Penicillin-binding protein n=1 Tax=Arcticibacter tournemirensis TaxID=699437 RepID=A0A5M9HEE3_9SPHI|nr:transglycosylase domain-containing protein [Arcticibacter tournemirensis]KAA8483648.1 penicillin-binding protein [Arcticibacter tournemirensis]TQM51396.1 penicillin-binding protein 1A [Arcticibacter tournemirensis]
MFKEIKNRPLRYTAIFLYFVIIFFCALELNFLGLFGYSPTIRDIKAPNMRIASELYTADGKLIGRYYKENRTPVEFNQITKSTVNALVATEDARFFSHSGIDIRSLLSSALSTVSGDKRGASTITQQLAKNLYRTRNNKQQGLIKYIPGVRTIVYKLKEWLTALKLEGQYSKEDILLMYLNTVPFGNNTFGIKTAAKKYFNKETDKLEVEQSALLVGMLKATTTYDPQNNPERALERRNVVLSQMEKYKYISPEEYNKYSRRPIEIHIGDVTEEDRGDSYLRSAVARYLDKWCDENGYDLYESGLKIYTTIDSKLQKYAEEAVADHMKILQKRLNNAWGNENPWRNSDGKEIEDFPQKAAQRLPVYNLLKKKYNNNQDSIDYYLNKPKKMKIFSWNGDKTVEYSTIDSIKYYAKILNTGMMTLDPFNGHIKVWIGGIDFNHFKYDHVNQAKRQAGSTFKPFAYLAALESGMSPCDKFIDKPVKIPYVEDDSTKYWEPKNSDYSFSGREMSLRWAMGKSVNSITAQITEKVGWDNVVKYAHECGIESELKSVPSVSLGSNDVSVFEMVRAYGTFLNKGTQTEPILVKHITDHDGNMIQEFKAEKKRSISEEIAWLMLYMFRGGMEEPGGTSRSLWEWDLWKKGNQIGGKTGTSSDYVDGWYMGITKDLVTGVWVGCDERSVHFRSSGTGEGAHTALPIFGKFMEKVYHDASTGYTYGPFPGPEVEITRDYKCPTPPPPVDTIATDSLQVDSLTIGDTIRVDEPALERPVERTPPTTMAPAVKPAEIEIEEDPKEERKRKREERREARRQKKEQQNN